MAQDLRYEEEYWGNDQGGPRRRQKSRRNDVYEGSVPIAKPGSNQFVAQTWRFFFYALFLCGAGASLAFLTPVPFFILPVAMIAMFISLFVFIVLHYAFENYSGAFYAFLFFAATFGIVLGPQLVLIAATVQNGMFIICAAAAATAGMTLMLHNYAWFKASFSLHRISLLGSFLSTALTGLIIIGLISLIFPTPLGMLLYGAAGVAVFSLYLVYDVYLLKIGAFKSPVEAAMNLFLDVMNLFLEMLRIFIAVQAEKSEHANLGEFFWKRILPLVGIALIVLSFGLLERWVMKDWHGIDEDQASLDDYPPPPRPSAPPAESQYKVSSASATQLPQDQTPENQNGTGFGDQQQYQPALQGQWPRQGVNQGGQQTFWGQGQQTVPPAYGRQAEVYSSPYLTQGPQYQQQQQQQGYNPSFTNNMSGQPKLYPPVPPEYYQPPPPFSPDAPPPYAGYPSANGAPVSYMGAPTYGNPGSGQNYYQ